MGKLIAFRSTDTDGEKESPDIVTQRELQNLLALRESLLLQARITRDRERELRQRVRAGSRIQPGRLRVGWIGNRLMVG